MISLRLSTNSKVEFGVAREPTGCFFHFRKSAGAAGARSGEGLSATATDVAARATRVLVPAARIDRKKGGHIAARLLVVSSW
jgi:hypothetical protein